jgi:hypothetical protein
MRGVVENSRPVIVYTYNEPKMILIKYNPKFIEENKVDLKKVEKYMFRVGKKVNTANLFRRMRDEQ